MIANYFRDDVLRWTTRWGCDVTCLLGESNQQHRSLVIYFTWNYLKYVHLVFRHSFCLVIALLQHSITQQQQKQTTSIPSLKRTIRLRLSQFLFDIFLITLLNYLFDQADWLTNLTCWTFTFLFNSYSCHYPEV